MEKKTRPIGDEFPVTRHNGTAGGTLVILKVVENNDLLCTKCYFHHNGCFRRDREYLGACAGSARTDGKGIVFEFQRVKSYM